MRRTFFTTHLNGPPLVSNIPGSVTWISFVLLALAAGIPVANLATSPAVVPAAPAQVEARISAKGYDRKQRPLPFTIYVLSQQCSWKLESTADLEGGQRLLNAELTNAVNHARDVFCVGTASFEGVTRVEETRAAQRAGTLAEWIRPVILNPRTRLFALNAGQYVGPKELQSTYQRRAIIIATGQHADDVDLREALTSGLLQKQSTFPFIYNLLHHYSRSSDWLKFPYGILTAAPKRALQ